MKLNFSIKILQLINDCCKMNLKFLTVFLTYIFVDLFICHKLYIISHFKAVAVFQNGKIANGFNYWQAILIDEFYDMIGKGPTEIRSELWKTVITLVKDVNIVCEAWLTNHKLLEKYKLCNLSYCDSFSQNMMEIMSELTLDDKLLLNTYLTEIHDIHIEDFNRFSAFFLATQFDSQIIRKSEYKLNQSKNLAHLESDDMFGNILKIDDLRDSEIKKRFKNGHNDFLKLYDSYDDCLSTYPELENIKIDIAGFDNVNLENHLKYLILLIHLLLCLSDSFMIAFNSNYFSFNLLLIPQIILGIIFWFIPSIPISIQLAFDFCYQKAYQKFYEYFYKLKHKYFCMKMNSKTNSQKTIMQKIRLRKKKASHKK